MQKEVKSKERNITAANPPAANRNHGREVTGGAQRGAAMKKRRNRRPILDSIRAKRKRRREEAELTAAMRWCGGGGVRNLGVLSVVRRRLVGVRESVRRRRR